MEVWWIHCASRVQKSICIHVWTLQSPIYNRLLVMQIRDMEGAPRVVDAGDVGVWLSPLLVSRLSCFVGGVGCYSALHVRLESKFDEKLFVLVMCDVALQCHSKTLNR